MKLIILYGPPASGKLTVAKVLSARTTYPLLHNHLVADFAHAVFEFGTNEYVDLAKQARLIAVDAALAARLPGLIMTFAYGVETKEGKQDDALLKSIKTRVERKGGTVTFVRLTCDESTLIKRVSHADRKMFGKLTKPGALKHILKTYRVREPILFADTLTVDTTKISPAEAARKIGKYLLGK